MAGGGKIKLKGGIPSKNEVQVIDGALLVTGINGVGGIRYSLVEQDTGLTWIDGKRIFQKTVNLGVLPNAVPALVAHGITTIDTLVEVRGTTRNDTGSIQNPLPFVQIGGADGIQIQVDATNVLVNPGAVDRSNQSGFVTIFYTKV